MHENTGQAAACWHGVATLWPIGAEPARSIATQFYTAFSGPRPSPQRMPRNGPVTRRSFAAATLCKHARRGNGRASARRV
jgi:hypothetical protein